MRLVIMSSVAFFFILLVLCSFRSFASDKHFSGNSVELGLVVDSSLVNCNDPSINSLSNLSINSSIAINGGNAYSVKYSLKHPANISVPFCVYRGETLKRTVYAWIEDDMQQRVSSKQKISLPVRFKLYDVLVSFGFSKCLPSRTYFIIAEGLGLREVKQVKLGFTGCIVGQVQAGNRISYSVLKYEAEVDPGKPFSTRVHISNPTQQNLEIDAWSYVYKSSKCVSGDREQNKKRINVPEYSNVTFDSENKVNQDTEPGEYRLKVKLLRSDRKTPKEIILPVIVRASGISAEKRGAKQENSTLSVVQANQDESLNIQEGVSDNSATGRRRLFGFPKMSNESNMKKVYESNSEKARGFAVYFLILVLALILFALIAKKL